MTEYIRARSEEQKQERRNEIISAAAELFAELPYHEITMGTIANKLGWSRSNLYKYAATQEEIFLSLHEVLHQEILETLACNLQNAPLEPHEFARRWAQAYAKGGEFLRCQEILVSIIESNVTLERLTAFKRSFATLTRPAMEALERQCGVSPAEAHDLYLRLLFQAPGLYNYYHSSEKTKDAMALAGLPPIQGTFEDAFADFVYMCLMAASRDGQ